MSRCFLDTHLNFAAVIMDRFLIGAILEGAALIMRVRLTLERCGAYLRNPLLGISQNRVVIQPSAHSSL